ncbi:unnamed protein product [Mytilus coruscus]|uniref:Mab-21-like nucleotidyltransferase domain-containing protein n=1 Tax=Mytilus coruscus TaxID=42192 RepID=A0A6J8D8E1_MYTCO|nr:unnamed protein product [Mytilus coruscus]
MTDVPKGTQHQIPIGFATIYTDEIDKRASSVICKGHIIPRKVHDNLYTKIKTAIKDLDLKDVHLSRNAHGPAVTLTKSGSKGKHDINIDITPTIVNGCIPVNVNGWPRPDTRKVLPSDTIDKITIVRTHLVPKGDEFWNISFSKAEKELMERLDKGNQCRRQCYKMLKTDLQTWKLQSDDNFPGISSHLLKLDIEVRREILIMIVEQINKTAVQQKQLSKSCEVKINGSIDSCKACNQDLCVPQPPPVYEAILVAVGTEALKPVLAAGEFVKSIGSQLSSTTKFLGGEAGEFVKDLGSVSKNIGKGLKDGVTKALDTIGSGFESLGNKFSDLGKSLSSGTSDLVNGLGSGTTDLLNGLGSEFTGLSSQLGGGLDSLGGSLTDLGNKLVDGVKNVGNSIGNTLGLCGANTISSQKNAIETIAYLRSLYNTTLTNHIVSKVEYDPTSIKTVGGVSFTNNFVTYTLYGQTVRLHSSTDLKITDITATAKSVAHQILKK